MKNSRHASQKKSRSVKLPFKARILDGLGSLLPAGLPNLSADTLLREAERQTGLSDWGDPLFREGIEALIRSFREESGCPFYARQRFKLRIVRTAAMRLRIVDTLKQDPGIVETPIRAPLIVAALPRTGTTLLQNLLGQDPVHRPLLSWEAQAPVPPPDPETHHLDPRIGRTAGNVRNLYRRAPGLKALHNVRAAGPVECNPLFVHDMASASFFGNYQVPSFLDWLERRDMTGPYRFYKQQLQILSWKFPEKRWLLKWTLHLYYLDALLAVFPDACIVQTHRDPLEVVPSTCSFACYVRGASSHWVDPIALAREHLHGLKDLVEKAMRFRETHGSDRILDIGYRELVEAPVETVRRIYQTFDLPYTSDFEEGMRAWLGRNRQHKHGIHHYSLEEFGLTGDDVRQAFSDYCERYARFL